jgi:hypothetical protein
VTLCFFFLAVQRFELRGLKEAALSLLPASNQIVVFFFLGKPSDHDLPPKSAFCAADVMGVRSHGGIHRHAKGLLLSEHS